MALLDMLKSLTGSSEETEYTYECGECDQQFTSTEAHPRNETCPACGSDRIHSSL